ncbi:MAG: glycosyltransferase family 2 protein [Cyanobacteriota bacterium]|nr:glycosyltransferase family 2 protein [Cyanobacteriota bacterium]
MDASTSPQPLLDLSPEACLDAEAASVSASAAHAANRGRGRPEISIIVPAYRGKATIRSCVGAVRQVAQGWNHEVLVVESSGDGTADLIRDHCPDVRVIATQRRLTAGQARNLGVRHARGRWIFCVDQDCIVPQDWIPRLLEHLSQPGVGAAGGAITVANPENISGWCVYFLEFLNHFPGRNSQTVSTNFLIGANSSWRVEVFTNVAFPDQTLGEDLLLSEWVKAQGYRVVYDHSIQVRHFNRQGWAEFRRYCRAMGRAAAQDQAQLGGWAIRLVQRCPALIFGAPLIILPRICWALRHAPLHYLLRFLALLPCCLFGQLLWAAEFRATLRSQSA